MSDVQTPKAKCPTFYGVAWYDVFRVRQEGGRMTREVLLYVFACVMSFFGGVLLMGFWASPEPVTCSVSVPAPQSEYRQVSDECTDLLRMCVQMQGFKTTVNE